MNFQCIFHLAITDVNCFYFTYRIFYRNNGGSSFPHSNYMIYLLIIKKIQDIINAQKIKLDKSALGKLSLANSSPVQNKNTFIEFNLHQMTDKHIYL